MADASKLAADLVGALLYPPTPELVKHVRQLSGLSQSAAAELIHCTRSGWAKWEGGEREMSLAHWELFLRKVSEMA